MNKGMSLIVVMVACAALIAAHQASPSHRSDKALIAQGKYLVTRVATCGDCHTPINPQGQPDMQRWLQGAPLGFTPATPVPGWTSAAPAIAGLPAGWSFAGTVRFLETGKMPDGRMAAPPMPSIRLTHHDAEAVAAYLASLPSGRK